MRTLIVTAFVSADGVMEAPGGEKDYRNSGWTFRYLKHVDRAYEIKAREENEASALLLGRKSYEDFVPIWPEMKDFARYNTLPRYVVSNTLQEDDERWPATILRTMEDIAALKETEGGPILVHGSGELGAALADARLVDRYHLLVFPLLLGSGKRLFSGSEHDATKLNVVEHELYENGIYKIVYDVVHED